AIQVTPDTVAIELQNITLADEIAFPGTVRIPATLSFNIVFSKTAKAHHIAPKSHDPIGPFHWLGDMSPATNSGTFSVSYSDGSFSAQGKFDSAGNFGEVGTEKNGSFAEDSQNEQAALRAPQEADGIGGITNSQVTREISTAVANRLATLLRR